MTRDPFHTIIFNFRDSYIDNQSPFLESDPNAIQNTRGLFFFKNVENVNVNIYYIFSPDNFKDGTLKPITLDNDNFSKILRSLQ